MTSTDLTHTAAPNAPDELDLDRVVASVLTRWPSAGVSVAVARDDAVDFFSHGVYTEWDGVKRFAEDFATDFD
jgi:hypothetical protein